MRLATAAAVLAGAAFLAGLQYSFDGFYDGDSYFHTRAARELARDGIQRSFPAAAFSTWSERYSDKDFLFHVFLIPFQAAHAALDRAAPAAPGGEDLIAPGKAAAVALGLLLLSALAFSLRLLGARWAPLWLLLLVATPRGVLGHMIALRPHLLGSALLLLEVALLCRRAPLPLALVSFAHGLTHSSFVLLPALAALAALAAWLRREPLPWPTLAAAVAGPLASLLFHPYFPNDLFVLRDQTLEVARHVWGVAAEIPVDLFGVELRAERTDIWLSIFPTWGPAVLGLLAWLARRQARALSSPCLTLTLACGLLLVLAAASARFLDFLLPLCLLLAGRVWTELADGRSLRALWEQERRATATAVAALGVCLASGVAAAAAAPSWLASEVTSRSVQGDAVAYLSEHAAPDDLVYHNFWWDFALLYHYRPQGRYIVALDPVFMYRRDPQRFARMLEGYRGTARDLHSIIAREFGARWVFVTLHPWFAPFQALLRRDSRFERVYADEYSEVYAVTSSAASAGRDR